MKALFLKKKSGFTLIELLVVISILAVLSVIGMTAYSSVLSRTRDVKRQEDLKSMATALELYYNAYNEYPEQTVTPCSSTTTVPANLNSFMKNSVIPEDPKGGSYCYYSLNNENSYRLFAKLENCPGNVPLSTCPNDYTYTVTSPDLIIQE